MKLYLISQSFNYNYDTFDSAIVAAEDDEAARTTKPSQYSDSSWAKPEHISVEYIGEARVGTTPGVILASFNAG